MPSSPVQTGGSAVAAARQLSSWPL